MTGGTRQRLHARGWTYPEIATECGPAHSAYVRRRREQYLAYFAAHPELRGNNPLLAKDLAAALPDDWDWLAEWLPVQERHRWHLSAKSSQMLALGLLGPAVAAEPDLRWLAPVAGVPAPRSPRPKAAFERPLAPELLNEHPRVTAIDFFVDDPAVLICAEAKWTETGLGRCSCRQGGGDPATGACARRVLDRKAYWQTAHELLGLPKRKLGKPCPLSPVYQAVRNVAAARALAAPGQQPVFALLYDAENPYFSGAGEWPGWPKVLEHTLAAAERVVAFRAVSWQALTPKLPLDAAARFWASEKHGLD